MWSSLIPSLPQNVGVLILNSYRLCRSESRIKIVIGFDFALIESL